MVSEQIKTRLEVAADERGTRVGGMSGVVQVQLLRIWCCCYLIHFRPLPQDVEDAQDVTLPSGVTYTDLRIGGGQLAARGLLVILNLKLWADGELIQVCCRAGAGHMNTALCAVAHPMGSTYAVDLRMSRTQRFAASQSCSSLAGGRSLAA